MEPWNYRSRLKAYKTLVAATQHCFFGAGGDGNILWGLALQFGWQYSTDRLSADELGAIPLHNWWGNMNYYLSIVPFIAAMEEGLFSNGHSARISIADPPRASGAGADADAAFAAAHFCNSAATCGGRAGASAAAAVDAWRAYFRHLKRSRAAFCAGAAEAASRPHTRSPAARVDYERLISRAWSAHKASIDAAVPRFGADLALLPAQEQEFCVMWAKVFVETFGMALYEVNRTQI